MCLRRVENRVQMLRDAQTHDIPDDRAQSRADRARPRLTPTGHALEAELARHRAMVSEEFAAVLMPQGGRAASVPVADAALWQRACDETLQAAALEASGFVPGDAAGRCAAETAAGLRRAGDVGRARASGWIGSCRSC